MTTPAPPAAALTFLILPDSFGPAEEPRPLGATEGLTDVTVPVELLGERYRFQVVRTDAERDATHVTVAELRRMRRCFAALEREVRRLGGGRSVGPRKGLRFADFAEHVRPELVGFVPGHGVRQARKAVRRMAMECTRSAAWRALLHELLEGQGAPVELRFGKNSCGFFADRATLAVDVDDLDALPQTARQGGFADAAGTGLTRGELLLRMLEQRLHWVRSPRHAVGHYQAQLRRERGLRGRLAEVSFAVRGDRSLRDVVVRDDQGNVTLVRDVPFAKAVVAGVGWEAGRAVVDHDREVRARATGWP